MQHWAFFPIKPFKQVWYPWSTANSRIAVFGNFDILILILSRWNLAQHIVLSTLPLITWDINSYALVCPEKNRSLVICTKFLTFKHISPHWASPRIRMYAACSCTGTLFTIGWMISQINVLHPPKAQTNLYVVIEQASFWKVIHLWVLE